MTHGNIQSKTIYAYTTGTLGTLLTTIPYTYNPDFPNELTAYNGQTISYDQSGNPTNYLGWTFAWGGGRRLMSARNSTNTISYHYDDNGIRTSKTVNGVTT